MSQVKQVIVQLTNKDFPPIEISGDDLVIDGDAEGIGMLKLSEFDTDEIVALFAKEEWAYVKVVEKVADAEEAYEAKAA